MADSQKSMNSITQQALPDILYSDDPALLRRLDFLRIASERLSQVRYVFIIQIEDGIPTAFQRSALEYSDAVLMGWPSSGASDLVEPEESQWSSLRACVLRIRRHLTMFRKAERMDKTDEMGEALIQIADNVAQIRKTYQPDFLLPTFAEIRRVVEDEWKADMEALGSGDIDAERLRSGFQSEGMIEDLMKSARQQKERESSQAGQEGAATTDAGAAAVKNAAAARSAAASGAAAARSTNEEGDHDNA